MSRFNLLEIEDKIGYKFSNKALLHQAFVAPSVSVASNNQKQNYQVLEFIGDSVLALALVKNIVKEFCAIDNSGQFVSKTTVGKLSKLKQEQEQNNTLEHCARVLTLNKFLEHDSDFRSQDSKNKKGDLIEAILGAVALDCKWDFDVICGVVKNILKYRMVYKNYSEKLEKICTKRNIFLPSYSFRIIHPQEVPTPRTVTGPDATASTTTATVTTADGTTTATTASNAASATEESEQRSVQFECFVSVPNAPKIFSAKGFDRLDAKNKACKEAVLYFENLEKQSSAVLQSPVSVLNRLCQRLKYSTPKYEFEEIVKNGKSSWKCEVSIEECELIFSTQDALKKVAKMTAATALLSHLNGDDEKIKTEFYVDDENVIRGKGLLRLTLSKYARAPEA